MGRSRGSRRQRVHDGAGRTIQADRSEESCGQRQVVSQNIGDVAYHDRADDMRLGVEEMSRLRRGTLEIEMHLVAFDGQLARYLEELIPPLRPRGHPIFTVFEKRDSSANFSLGSLS